MPWSVARTIGLALTFAVGMTGLAQAQAAHHHGSVHPVDPPLPPPTITLERTGCKGQCAEYKLSFYDDGLVVYDGKAGASKEGRWRGHVPKETVTSLLSDFDRARYDTLAATYGPGLTPSPTAITSIRKNDQTKTVVHDEGSPFSPSSLTALEDRLDVAVESVSWTR